MSVVTDERIEELDRYDFAIDAPPDAKSWTVMVVAALLFDAAARRGPATTATALLLAAVALGVIYVSRSTSRDAHALAAAAVMFAVFPAVRTSPWVLLPSLAASFGCTVIAASLAREGRFSDLTIPRLALRLGHAFVHAVFAVGYVRAGVPTRSHRRFAGLGRGLVMATPLVLVLGLLLASADAVFASFFRLPDIGQSMSHVALFAVGLLLMAALLRTTAAAPVPRVGEPPRFLGTTEALTVLSSMVVLYALFAVAQMVTLAGGARHVLETEGLTYAEYARSGFFQLLAVAAITLAVLLGVRTVTDLSDLVFHRRFVVFAEAAVALTLVIVIVAIRRLALYDDAFGLTMLRLAATVFAWWLGAVFIAVGIHLAGFLRSIAPVAMVLAAVTLFAWGASNPEAYVVRHNLGSVGAGADGPDIAYLASLSDDAFAELAARVPVAPEVQGRACRVDSDNSLLDFNLSRRRALAAAAGLCPSQPAGATTQSFEVPPGS